MYIIIRWGVTDGGGGGGGGVGVFMVTVYMMPRGHGKLRLRNALVIQSSDSDVTSK